MVGVDEVGVSSGPKDPRSERVSGMVLQQEPSVKNDDLEAAVDRLHPRAVTEGHESAGHVTSDGAPELKGIALTSTVEPAAPKQRWSDMSDAH